MNLTLFLSKIWHIHHMLPQCDPWKQVFFRIRKSEKQTIFMVSCIASVHVIYAFFFINKEDIHQSTLPCMHRKNHLYKDEQPNLQTCPPPIMNKIEEFWLFKALYCIQFATYKLVNIFVLRGSQIGNFHNQEA